MQHIKKDRLGLIKLSIFFVQIKCLKDVLFEEEEEKKVAPRSDRPSCSGALTPAQKLRSESCGERLLTITATY